MPNIRIKERDYTAQPSYNPTESIVYVPGFAGTGATKTTPINTPTLCRSVSDFEALFGKTPKSLRGATADPTAGSNAFQFPSGVTGGNVVEGDADIGYLYAHQLLTRGIPVLYEAVQGASGAETIEALYTKFIDDAFWSRLATLEYDIKFITSGGYPTFEFGTSADKAVIVKAMMTAAQARGDAVALIDYHYIDGRTLDATNTQSVYSVLQTVGQFKDSNNVDYGTFGAMFAPYCDYTISKVGDVATLTAPGSFGYLLALSESTNNNNPDYLAVAGISRGKIPGFKGLKEDVTSAIAHTYNNTNAKMSINCIAPIRNMGTVIWSNRTLRYNEVADPATDTAPFGVLPALALLNLRVMTCDIKKTLTDGALRYMFENNSDILWLNYRSRIEDYLDKIVSNNGLRTYTINRLSKDSSNTIQVGVTLYPVQPVENWDITVELKDETSEGV